jgi:putative transposase
LRREILEHIIPFDEKHLDCLLREYFVHYYNPHRTHQGIERQTPFPWSKTKKVSIADTSLISEPVLGGPYHNYHKAS